MTAITKTFKITLENTGETRRIPRPNSYPELSKCLSLIWGDHPFILTYQDEEGDTIAVSTEMEFDESMNVAKDMGCKVFKFKAYTNPDELRFYPQDKKADINNKEKKPIHFGIVCDRSGMNPIAGTRYHVRGDDSDLCEEEFAKLPQTERNMFIKMGTPLTHKEFCRKDRFGRMVRPLKAEMSQPVSPGSSNNNHDNRSPLYQVLSSFVDAANVASAESANGNLQSSQGTIPLADLLGAIQHVHQKSGCKEARGCSSDASDGHCNNTKTFKIGKKKKKKNVRVQNNIKQIQEHLMKKDNDQDSEELPDHPLAALFTGLFDPSQNPCVQGGSASSATSPESREPIHVGVACDQHTVIPQVKRRYRIPGTNVMLYTQEFENLPERTPDQTPIPHMEQKSKEPTTGSSDNQEESTRDTTIKQKEESSPSSAAAEADDNGDDDDDLYSDDSDSDDYEGTVKPIVSKNKMEAKNLPSPPVAETIKKPQQAPSTEVTEDEKFADQLVELASMGFVDRDANLALLNRYRGRVDRVVNSIIEFAC